MSSFLQRLFATYERTPYAFGRHRPDIKEGDWATRQAYQDDVNTRWTDRYGRDQLHKTLRMYQPEPTRPATGMYTPDGGGMEINPAHAAPTVGADPAQMSMAEAVRSYLDAQGGGAWHGVAPEGWSDALRIGMERPATRDQMMRAKEIGEPFGMGDISDTGRGMTVTSFEGRDLPYGEKGALMRALRDEFNAPITRGRLQSDYISNEKEWQNPDGSGALTRLLRDRLQGPGADRLLDSPEIARLAEARYKLDDEAARAGVPVREDLQRARLITAKDRLRGLLNAASQGGVALPAIAGGVALSGEDR